jgi:hypothetical protein
MLGDHSLGKSVALVRPHVRPACPQIDEDAFGLRLRRHVDTATAVMNESIGAFNGQRGLTRPQLPGCAIASRLLQTGAIDGRVYERFETLAAAQDFCAEFSCAHVLERPVLTRGAVARSLLDARAVEQLIRALNDAETVPGILRSESRGRSRRERKCECGNCREPASKDDYAPSRALFLHGRSPIAISPLRSECFKHGDRGKFRQRRRLFWDGNYMYEDAGRGQVQRSANVRDSEAAIVFRRHRCH